LYLESHFLAVADNFQAKRLGLGDTVDLRHAGLRGLDRLALDASSAGADRSAITARRGRPVQETPRFACGHGAAEDSLPGAPPKPCEAEWLVEQLWREKNDPAEVVAALRSDRVPSEALRQAALRAVRNRRKPPRAIRVARAL
jgi:hypothetical protein